MRTSVKSVFFKESPASVCFNEDSIKPKFLFRRMDGIQVLPFLPDHADTSRNRRECAGHGVREEQRIVFSIGGGPIYDVVIEIGR